MNRLDPAIDGAVHALERSSDTRDSTFSPAGETVASERPPSSSKTISLPSAYTKEALGKVRSCQSTLPVLASMAVSGAGPKSPLDP